MTTHKTLPYGLEQSHLPPLLKMADCMALFRFQVLPHSPLPLHSYLMVHSHSLGIWVTLTPFKVRKAMWADRSDTSTSMSINSSTTMFLVILVSASPLG